ncbi:hypothetical protein MMC19_004954 [Ptychographa xylographoides]|nr:hypothetical protein [Ptychographa xylographoides]
MGISEASKAAVALVFLLLATAAVGGILLYLKKRKIQVPNDSAKVEEARVSAVPQIQQTQRPQPSQNSNLFELDAVEAEFKGFFGGKSRSGASQSTTGSMSSTLVGSRKSLSRKSLSRKSLKLFHMPSNASIVSMPVDIRLASPLKLNPVAAEDVNRYQITRKAPPIPDRPRAAELESIVSISRPSTAHSRKDFGSPLSSPPMSPRVPPLVSTLSAPLSPPEPPPIPGDAPKLDLRIKDFRATFKSLFFNTDIASQFHASQNIIPRKPVAAEPRGQSRRQSRLVISSPLKQESNDPPQDLPSPPRVFRGERPFFGGTAHERSASKGSATSSSIMNRKRGDPSKLMPHSPFISIRKLRHQPIVLPAPPVPAIHDWGAAIFQDIDSTLEVSRSLTASPVKDLHDHDTRRSSAASSIYSLRTSLEKATAAHQRQDSKASQQTSHSTYPLLTSKIYAANFESNHDSRGNSSLSLSKSLPELQPPAVPRKASTRQLKPAQQDESPQPHSAPSTPAIHQHAVGTRPMSDVLSDVYDSYWQQDSPDDRSRPRDATPLRSKSERIRPAKVSAFIERGLPPLPRETNFRASGTRFPVVPHSHL